MHGALVPWKTRVRSLDRAAARGVEVLSAEFLQQARESALAHFEGHTFLPGGCVTVQCRVAPRPGTGACPGTIMAHVSGAVLKAWEAAADGSAAEKKAHVLEQLQLVLTDMADHDTNGCLALTDAQRDVYDQDLAQLVTESLDRTTFCRLRRKAEVHWEGTLVRSLRPPFLVVVVSICFARPAMLKATV
jgi:hypothetical protein